MQKIALILVTIVLSSITATHAGDTHTGDAKRGEKLAGSCGSCHGNKGNSTNPMWPKLAGQHEKYIVRQLQEFKKGAEGTRNQAVMAGLAARLSLQDMHDLGAYYAGQTIKPGFADKDQFELGAKIYRGGNLDSGVPSCQGCHGPQGKGTASAGFAALGGQHAEYISTQLKAFKNGQRGAENDIMPGVVAKMTTAEIEAVSQYIQGLH